MSKRRGSRFPDAPLAAVVDDLAPDGRGIAHVGARKVLIAGALAGEEVLFRYTGRHRDGDTGAVVEVTRASPQRVVPGCGHFERCGGCSLQHLEHRAQLQMRQDYLLECLRRGAGAVPRVVLAPISAALWGYRRKARLGVKYVEKKDRVLVGFREKGGSFLAELARCPVLHPSIGERLSDLRLLIQELAAARAIPQLEVAVGEGATALIFRHLAPLGEDDRARLTVFGRRHDLHIYLQGGGPQTITALWPESPPPLSYRLPEQRLELEFGPGEFTQVNLDVNRHMVARALALLGPRPGEKVLDLFCGIGNFTLALARRGAQVVGVEGDAALVERARANARRNGVTGVRFQTADLRLGLPPDLRAERSFVAALIDPPRSGAGAVVEALAALGIPRILYVSCNPQTLGSDLGAPVQRYGYHLACAGVVDMFPHTGHMESMVLLERA